MQSLDVISINFWQILVSLCNLIILFLLIKKLFYKPVKKMLSERQQSIEKQYSDAEAAKSAAEESKAKYENELSLAKKQADGVIQSAVVTANAREKEIIDAAKERADSIIRKAERDAELELRKAEESIKAEIINVSSALTEKILSREVNTDDHKKLVDEFIDGIGENGDE